MQQMRFQPNKMAGQMQLNQKQQACLITLVDAQGNTLELAMTVEFGAQLVAATRAAFRAIEDRDMKEEGTTAEERQSFASKSAMIGMPITAVPNPAGTSLSPVLVTIAPASTYEQSFGLTEQQAVRLAEELQTAASQVTTDQS